MRSPMGYATLIVLLAALPVFFIEGVSGSFFEPLVARLRRSRSLASMLVALTVTPALSLMLLVDSRGAARGESPLARLARAALRRGARAGRREAAARCSSPPRVAALAGLALIPALDGPVIPSFKDRDVLVAPRRRRPARRVRR